MICTIGCLTQSAHSTFAKTVTSVYLPLKAAPKKLVCDIATSAMQKHTMSNNQIREVITAGLGQQRLTFPNDVGANMQNSSGTRGYSTFHGGPGEGTGGLERQLRAYITGGNGH
jgi:hypothetical protein